MKARRRHELKESALAHELGKARTFLNRYGNWVLVGVTGVLIVVLIVWYHQTRTTEAEAEERARYHRLTRADPDEQLTGLIELAENARNVDIGARSAVNVGDLYATRYRNALMLSAAVEAQGFRGKAEQYYRLAIDKYPDLKLFTAKAHFGLAVLAENDGNGQGAEAEYKQVLALLDPAHTIAREAQYKLSNLKILMTPVRYATTTQASQPAATAPATGAATSKPAPPPAPE